MARQPSPQRTGVFLVLILVGGAVLLIVAGNWLKAIQPRRAPVAAGEAGRGALPSPPQGEIEETERQQLERILRERQR